MKKINKKIGGKAGGKRSKNQVKNQVKIQGKIGVKMGKKINENASTLGCRLGLDSGKVLRWLFHAKNPCEKTITQADNKLNFRQNTDGKINRDTNNINGNVRDINYRNGLSGSRRWEGVSYTCLLTIPLLIILITSLIFIVSALTDDEKSILQAELTQLENNLSNNGYDWLINYSMNYPSVKVYKENSNELLAQFGNIIGSSFNKYKIFLTNLEENESYSTFDLKSAGDVEYDYVVDPRVYGIPKGMNLLNNSYGTFAGISATSSLANYYVIDINDNHQSGDAKEGWLGADGSVTNQNITINLTNSYSFDTIEIFAGFSGGLDSSPNNTNVYVSDDAVTWTKIANKSLFGGVAPTVITEYDTIRIPLQTKKYIIMEFKDNLGNANYLGTHEIRIYKNTTNLANLTTTIVTATSTDDGKSINGSRDEIMSGAVGNVWWSDDGVTRANITWNFGSAKRFSSLEHYGYELDTTPIFFPNNYSIYVSDDGSTWTKILTGNMTGGSWSYMEMITFPEQNKQYLKYEMLDSWSTRLIANEIRIWEQNDTTAAGELCDSGSYSTTCNISTTHYLGDGDIVMANNLNILQGGSLQNTTANCSGTSHGCGFSLILTGNLTIFSGGNITAGNISITAGNVNVNSGGMIITDGLGWFAGMGPSPGASYLGAAYGGLGGIGSCISWNWSKVYGNPESPVDFGSGGASATPTSSGAGIVFINSSGNLNITGIVSAFGNNAGCDEGGGSGGSIWLVANSLSGNGNISSQGGSATCTGKGGGGGRIRTTFTINQFTGIISVAGGIQGSGYSDRSKLNVAHGKAGTYSFSDGNNLTVKDDMALAAGTYNIPYLNVTNGAILYIQPNLSFSGNGSGVVINSVNVNLDNSSIIYGGSAGFMARAGPGYQEYYAGSHGGLGSTSGGVVNPSRIYGSETYPMSLGSGGQASDGSGAIFLNATGNVTINGNISVLGMPFTCGDRAGAGGSILIVADNISGSGNLLATGGLTTSYSSGGGGRIALHASRISLTGLIDNSGGAGPATSLLSWGWGGTIYINATNSITSTGNITATGYNGTTARISFITGLAILTGIYNASATNTSIPGIVNGTINMTYSNCSSILTGTFIPAYTKSNCADCSGNYILTIISPANNTNFNISQVSFNASTSLYSTTCLLSLNNAANVSMTANSSYTGFNYTNSSIGDGSYNATIFCTDTLGDSVSSTIKFLVDTSFPTITISNPLNNSYWNNASVLFNVSSSETSAGTGSIVPNLDNSLVSWWRMDDLNATGGVVDYMGRNNGTAVGGASQVTNGKLGKGFSFDGSSGYVQVANNASYKPTGAMTISAWVKGGNIDGVAAALGTMGTAGASQRGFALGQDSDGDVICQIANTSTTTIDVSFNGFITDTLVWNHIVMVYNPSTYLYLYKNGVYVAQNTTTVPAQQYQDNGLGLRIGDRGDGVYAFNGSIDDVMIFNRSLTSNEIQALYNATQINHQQVSLADGSHSFRAYVQDYAANIVNSGVNSFVVDTGFPDVSFVAPSPSNGSYIPSSSFVLNVSASDTANNISTFVDFDSSLVSWWRMDDLNATGGVVDYMGRNNGTAVGGASQVTNGKLGKGFSFDGSSGYVNTGDVDALNNFTVSAWVYGTNTNLGTFITKYADSNNRLEIDFSSSFLASIGNGTTYKDLVGGTLLANRWYHVVVNYNGTNLIGYLNGGYSGSSASITNARIPDTGTFRFGQRNNDRWFNGSIDDVMIFNRSLSAQEIAGLYANQTTKYCYDNETKIMTENGWKYFAELKDGEKVMTLNQETGEKELQLPTESQIFNNNEDMYAINADNGELVVSPEHKIYGKIADESNGERDFNLSNNSFVLNTGTFSCFFNNFSSDQIGQLNLSARARYSLSFSCPVSKSPAFEINEENSCSGINLTLSLKTDNNPENSASVRCVFDNISSLLLTNSSKINSGATNSIFLDTNISLDDLLPLISSENSSLASITISIYLHLLENLFDKASLTFLPNLNASSCVNSLSFEKDSKTLSCTIFFSNASLATSDQFITLNSDSSSFNLSGIDIVKFGILPPDTFNHINTQNTHIYKSFGSSIEGLGNINTTNFSLMRISDVYSGLGSKQLIMLDENGNEIKVNSIKKINYTGKIYDITVPNHIILVKRGDLIVWSGNSLFNYTNLADGSHTFKAYAQDTSGNVNLTSLNSVTVDTGFPTIDYSVPTENDYANKSHHNIFVNVSVTETNPANITFSLYNYSIIVNSTTYSMATSTSNNTINWTGLSDSANYTYNVTIVDSANNANTTALRHITLDTTPPSLAILYPSNLTTHYTSILPINVTVSDNIMGMSSCWYHIDTDAGNYTLYAFNSTFYNSTYTIAHGLHNITVWCNDTLNNVNSTSMNNFNVNLADLTVLNVTLPAIVYSMNNTLATINISNIGPPTVTNVNVSCYADGVIMYSRVLATVAGLTSYITNCTINFNSGLNQNLTVIVDPQNTIPESNENNNNMTIGFNATMIADIAINLQAEANTTDIINVNGQMAGNDNSLLANKLFTIKLNNVTVSSNSLNYSGFSSGTGANVNISSDVRLNLTSEGEIASYTDAYSTTNYQTDEKVMGYSDIGFSATNGQIFDANQMSGNAGNITYRFLSITEFFNASVYITTSNTYIVGGGNSSLWYSFDNSTWTLLSSTTQSNTKIGRAIPGTDRKSIFYIRIQNDKSQGDNPVTQFEANYSNYDYSSSGIYNSSSINLANVTYTVLRWSQQLNGGDIKLQLRESDDNVSWSSWSDNYTSHLDNDISSFTKQYIQFKAFLSTTNLSLTPVLQAVQIYYFNASTNSTGGYSYNITIPTNSLGVQPLQVSISQTSGLQIIGSNSTNISIWARTSLPYSVFKNYSGESNYSVYANFTREDIGSNVNGTINITIYNSTYQLSRACSGFSCIASWLIPSDIAYGNYTINITGSNMTSYYRNSSVSFNDYLEEKNTTATLHVLNKTIADYNPAQNYSFYWNASLTNNGKASINNPHVWAYEIHSAIQSVSELSPCSKIYPGQSCNATMFITVKTNVNPSDTGYYITWRANWTDNDGSITGGTGYIQYTGMRVIILGNSSLALSNYSVNTSIEHNSAEDLAFRVLSVGSTALSSINVSFLSQNITAGGTIPSSWVSISPDNGWINSIVAGGSSDLTATVTVPAQTPPGNYSGIINASANAGGEKLLNLIVNVPLNTSWYYMPAENFTYNRSFSLNSPGEIANITIFNTGNINLTMNLSYIPAGTKDFTALDGLFTLNKDLGGLTGNPSSVNATKGENSTITIVHNGWDEEKLDIGIILKMQNETADPGTAYYQDSWEVKEQYPNITNVWFYLDGTPGNIAEQHKNLTIKFRATDDVDLNLTGSKINISWSAGQKTQISAYDLSGVVGGTEWVNNLGKYSVMNYTGNYTPESAEQYSIIASVFDTSGKAVSSSTYTFTSYGTTTISLGQNVSIINVSNVDSTHKSVLYVNYTINNTGLVKGYSLNLSFSGNSSIIAAEKSLGNISGGRNTSSAVQINVSELTWPGQYNLTATLKWTNPSGQPDTTLKTLVINVAQNKSVTNSPATPSLTVSSGDSNSTNLLLNNTGNDNLASMSLSCYSGTLCSSFTFTANESSFSISRNSIRYINITLSAPNGLAAGSYSGFVNISEQSISKTFEIQASVPETKTWTASPLSINMTRGASSSGKLADVTITNTGNVNMTFNLATTNSSLIAPNVSSIMVPLGISNVFAINYTAPAEEASYSAIITMTNADSGASPAQLNISVNITVTALGITIISPNSTSPIMDLTAGQNISIIGNATYGGISITENLTWNASIDSTSCSSTSYSYNSNDYWNLTCTLPSLPDGRYHNVTATTNHNIYGTLSQTEENAVYYRDITPPNFTITRNHVNLGGNINLQAGVSDNLNISDVSAVLTYPDSSQINISLSLSGGLYINNSITLNSAGEYLVNYTANDTTNNRNSTTDWFEVYDRYLWIPRLADYDNNPQAGINMTLFRQNTTTILLNNITDSGGKASFNVNKRYYDIKAVFSSDYIIVKNVNFTNVTASGINFNLYRIVSGDLAEIVTLHKTFQGFASNSTNLSGNLVQAVFNYTGAGYSEPTKLEVVKCADWNFTSRTCMGIWSIVSSSRSIVDKTITGNSTGFSAYFLSENTCGTNGCESTYGETTSTCPDDCKETTVSVPPSGGGGGGGGGLSAGDLARIEDIVKSFLNVGGVKLETTSIYKEMFAGDVATVRLKLKNTLSSPLTISLDTAGDIKQFIFFENSEITLSGKEDRDILIKIIAPKTVEPGNYDGDLVLKSGKEEGKIPVAIRILSPEGKLLDVKIEPLTSRVAPGDVLRLKTTLLNLGKSKQIDVQFELQLIDVNTGAVITRTEEAFAVETTIDTIKNMTIPETTAPGKYLVKATAYYSNKEMEGMMQASSIAEIYVQYSFFRMKIIGIPVWAYSIVVLLILVIIGISFYIRHLEFQRRRFKVRVEVNKLPQPGMNSGFIGKIAETGIRAFNDMNKMQMHTLIAGATGGGKTIAAQDLIEEALLHNKSVVIFDPTAQWTGFLRKCEDSGMLKRYKYFEMNTKNARAFNGSVKTIHDPYEMINIEEYMNRQGEVTIFNISNLTPKEIDVVVASTIEQIFSSKPEESKELKTLIVYDEVHRLLPKFGGSGQGFVQLERGCREFRKWGIGLVLISQVLSDFIGEVKANIGTEIQMGTRYEGDLERVNMKYGEDILKSVVREPIGTGMVVNAEYNSGKPYFVSFRPILHSTKRLSNTELEKYEKYFNEIEDMDYQIAQLKLLNIDVLDLELEIRLAKGKVKEGAFQMADMYLESLNPRFEEAWKKSGKTPKHLVRKKIRREEVEAGIKTAEKEREKYIKKNPQETLSVEQEMLGLKKSIEEKKKSGKKTDDIETKFNDLGRRIKDFKGKLAEKDAQGIMQEIEAIKKEAEKI